MQRIVVDAMGGDHAPEEIVKGAAEASLTLPHAEIILVGDAATLGRKALRDCIHNDPVLDCTTCQDFVKGKN